MANELVTITDLTAATALADADLFEVQQSSTSKKCTAAIVGTYLRTGIYREVWIGAGAMVARTTNPAASATVEMSTNKNNLDVFDFDKDAIEYVHFAWSPPDNWDRDTIKAKFYWTAASGTGDVIFGVQAIAVSNDDTLDVAFGTAQTATDTLIAANDCHVTAATSAITVGGTPALGDMIMFQVYRNATDGGDTLSVDARLIGVKIQYKELTTVSAAW